MFQMKSRLLFFIFFITTITHAQTFDWWKNLVHWDGITNWSKYLTFSPGLMGVNALPVPLLGNGSIDSVSSIGITGNLHFSKGDNSQNPTLYGNYCFAKNRLSFDVNWIPVEWFQMSHAVKEKRKVYWQDYYRKKAHGDLYLNATVQLMNRWRQNIDLALRLGYKYATSDGEGAARMTGMPGYYFDISAGKKFSQRSNWKAIATVGLYIWETNSDIPRFFQDDALLTGAGVEFNKNKFRMQTCVAGYFGYIEGYDDDPMLYRLSFEKKFKKISGLFRFQQGLHDFNYTSIELGMKYFY